MNKLLICLALVLTGCAKKNHDEPTSWLYVVSSSHGEIKSSGDGYYELIIEHDHIDKVVAFSNRPERVVRHISNKDFKKLWREGVSIVFSRPSQRSNQYQQ